MRTMLYHMSFPMGKVFDTETNKPDPHVSHAPFGSVDSPAKLSMTQDQLIDSIVKHELAKHNTERTELEKELAKKTGDDIPPHFAATESSIAKVLDDPNVKPKRKPGRPRKGT